MKLLSVLITFSLVSSYAATKENLQRKIASNKNVVVCSINYKGKTIPFSLAVKNHDSEYETLEMIKIENTTFYLKAGHGVARLESYEKNTFHSATSYSYGRDPKETDKLVLIRTIKNSEVEASCFNVDSKL